MGCGFSELVELRWSQIAWEGTARLTVARRKGSVSGVAQALGKDEVRWLRQIQREQPAGTSHIFQGERGAVAADWFRRMLRRVGLQCGLALVHPHQLRHGCGFALADKGRDLREIQMQLGHKSISNTVGYVELRPGRLDRVWDLATRSEAMGDVRGTRARGAASVVMSRNGLFRVTKWLVDRLFLTAR
jgi:type 1 fimbriae regulatory protein FimB/type 1 fimbriae regulatory protein FimE